MAGEDLGAAIRATIADQGIAIVYLSRRVCNAHERQDTDLTLREVASRYHKMALVGVPNVVVDALRASAIPILIITYPVTTFGQLDLVWLTLQAPVTLVTGALS